MIEFGHFAAILAFCLSGLQGVQGLRGQRGPAAFLALTALGAMGVSFLTLVMAFARSDFSVALVANHSHTLKPFLYKIAGTWGNHEGSMALWCLVTLGFGAAGAVFLRTGRPKFEARSLGIQGLVAAGSLAYLLFASSPFMRVAEPELQGDSLNPLLQDPALAFHPPLLYLGYVGYSFVFAMAAAALIEARVDRIWAKAVRGWAMAAFVPLSGGIMLGALWAYYELGWGGWWFWDPVENASLMPWLLGAALLHSLIVTEKRGGFAVWSVLLAVLAFCFSILGAFLVRSGILTSVHAFADDPTRGLVLLIGLLAYGGAALGLFAFRAYKIKGGPIWAAASREGALMGNNLILAVATATVLLGTLFPLIAEAFGRQMSVGEPYFRLTFVPIMAPALIALPVVQAWSWGRMDLSGIWKWAAAFAGICAVFGLLGVGLMDIPLFAALGVALGVWLVGGSMWELKRRAVTWPRLLKLPLRVWGMTLAHIGLGVFVVGAVVETSQRYETTLDLAMGGRAEVAGWTLSLEDMRVVEGPNWFSDRATISASKGGAMIELRPEKRYYPAARMPTSETAIHKSPSGDLYLALGDRREVNGQVRWTFRAYFNPLIDLVFGGVILMALGGLFSVLPRGVFKARARQADMASLPAGELAE
ncbi:MAG: heme lyase CcmF/NrfE family subunit [Hyphomonadaceae bacterium]|nr:heme lyase CcmF/NrfE family subunit [Hyphomonadaceae bacterium]